MLRLGLVGLPGCGKTALFRALTGAPAHVGVGGKREVHVGQARVPDERLDELNVVFGRPRAVHAVVEYVDVVGFASGEAKRSGFEDHFLGDIRTCDALLHMVRNFETPGLPAPDAMRDFNGAQAEFLISDQIILENRSSKLQKEMQKHPTPEGKAELELLHRALSALAEEKPLRELSFAPAEALVLKAYQPLSLKPQLVVLNVSEEDIQREAALIESYRPKIESVGILLLAACASIEMEIAELDGASAAEFMADLGIEASALSRINQASYSLLGLISFFTVGDDECRAWTVHRGATAKDAAGEVHSDMARGFIRAEVVHFNDFISRKSFATCRHDGVFHLEGKDYLIQDGDVIQFRFAL